MRYVPGAILLVVAHLFWGASCLCVLVGDLQGSDVSKLVFGAIALVLFWGAAVCSIWFWNAVKWRVGPPM